MARLSLGDIVAATNVNVGIEFKLLWHMLNGRAYELFPDDAFKPDGMLGGDYDERSFFDVCDESFESFPVALRGTCRSLRGFTAYYGLNFDKVEKCSLDDLLLLVEFAGTFVVALDKVFKKSGGNFYSQKIINDHVSQHIVILAEKLGHKMIYEDQFVKLVPNDVVTIEVATKLPMYVAIKTFMYNHRSMRGNLAKKREVLLALGEQLEPRRNQIANSQLSGAIFNILNNMNIRHNNVAKGSVQYRPYVASLKSNELEIWYDRLYQMMLAAFSWIDSIDCCRKYEEFKDKIGAVSCSV